MLLGAALAAACSFPGRHTGPEEVAGTCEGACEHYVECRDQPDPEDRVYSACLRECRTIFVESGRVDEVSLGLFEGLACEDAVGFIEGEGGRPAGSSPPELGSERERSRGADRAPDRDSANAPAP